MSTERESLFSPRQCAHRKCRRKATVAYDVWSWFKPQREQTPRHYEVCAKHEPYFTGQFQDTDSAAVERDMVAS